MINQKQLNSYLNFLNSFSCKKTHIFIDDPLSQKYDFFSTDIKTLTDFFSAISFTNIERYQNFPKNNHHWTTNYVWKNVFPKIMDIVKIEKFDVADFKYVENKHIVNGELKNLSYHKMIAHQEIQYEEFDTNIKKCGGLDILRDKKYVERSYYHSLFIGNHRCCLLTNKTCNSQRKLLLNTDSMSIPLIPLLICYFNKILVLDNRTNSCHIDIIKEFNPTDYIALGLYRQFLYKTNSNIICGKIFQRNIQ